MTKQVQFKVRVAREVPGEYVRAGATYSVTAPSSRKGRYHFRNDATGGATDVTAWDFTAAVKRGDFVMVGADAVMVGDRVHAVS